MSNLNYKGRIENVFEAYAMPVERSEDVDVFEFSSGIIRVTRNNKNTGKEIASYSLPILFGSASYVNANKSILAGALGIGLELQVRGKLLGKVA